MGERQGGKEDTGMVEKKEGIDLRMEVRVEKGRGVKNKVEGVEKSKSRMHRKKCKTGENVTVRERMEG